MGNPFRVCETCKHFEREEFFSQGTEGICFLLGDGIGINTECDDTCDDWEKSDKEKEETDE